MLGMIEMARAALVSTVTATTVAVDVASRRLMETAGLRLVQTLVGGTEGPTAELSSRKVQYALDLTNEDQVRAAAPAH
jgi:hypothetical protein